MKLRDKAKSLLQKTTTPLLATVLITKNFTKADTMIEGNLELLSREEMTVTHISYHIEELLEQSFNNATRLQAYPLGDKEEDMSLTLTPLLPQSLSISCPVDFNKSTLAVEKVYSGDMALLNKSSDKAKKSATDFKITVTITASGLKNPLVVSAKLSVANQ
jgi:hypothetical protein